MAKSKKKKVVVSPSKSNADSKIVKTAATAKTSRVKRAHSGSTTEMVFGKQNFLWVGIGIALIALGMLLMVGGFNENPAVWDESEIYGFRRTVLAPILILGGLVVQIYAIFKDKN